LDEVAPTFKSLLEGAGGGLLPSSSAGLPDLSGPLQLLAGGGEAEADAEAAARDGRDVSFRQAQVEGIDVANRQVVISTPEDGAVETVDYDALVVATGAEIALDAVPGAADYALPFYTVDQALELKRRLALLDQEIADDRPVDIVVVGGGYSGVELALNLADRFGGGDGDAQVTLVHRGEILEYATEHNRRTGTDRLRAAGVNVRTSTSVVEVLPGEAGDEPLLDPYRCRLALSTRSEDGTQEETAALPAALLLWTAGATPASQKNAGVRNSVLPRDARGRLLTSPTLNVPEHPEVFAVGDCGRPRKAPYPATAQVALQQATVAAWNVRATLEPAPRPRPFQFLDLGEMMTLGSDDATLSTLGGAVELSGPAASWLRRWIYAARMPTAAQGLRAGLDGTGRKLARGRARGGGSGGRRRKSKPVPRR